MAYELNWNLLGDPAADDIGRAVQAGFQTGATRSALADLSTDPTNESALARLAMFHPEAAEQYRERGRAETLRAGLRSAFDPATGNIDPVAARSAYAEAGDIPGAIEFDRNRAVAQTREQEAHWAQIRRMADLLDDSTDAASYARNREIAIRQLGANPADIPEQFDPSWVASQRQLVGVLGDRRQMTSLMQNVAAAGYDLNTPEGQAFMRQMLMQPRVVTLPNGQVVTIGGDTSGGGNPPPLTDDDFADEGGPAPAAGPATFP